MLDCTTHNLFKEWCLARKHSQRLQHEYRIQVPYSSIDFYAQANSKFTIGFNLSKIHQRKHSKSFTRTKSFIWRLVNRTDINGCRWNDIGRSIIPTNFDPRSPEFQIY